MGVLDWLPILYIVLTVLCIVPVILWQGVVALAGLWPLKKRPQIEDKQHRFAIVISARHEEAVIGNLLDSLNQQDYPRELFDVFVIADNCTQDNTADVARAHGAKVYERFNTVHVGKGYALQWGFSQIRREFADRYDAYCIFDADNLATSNFLTKINETLCTGADVVQGYRDTKNAGDSWVSGCYAIYWYMFMRFFNQARNNLGLSCLVSGTGFAFRAELLEPNGWTACTLTEDMEFSVQQIMAGRTIIHAPQAIFFDEQPTKFSVSICQRHRWSVGCVQVLRSCRQRTLEGLRSRRLTAWDMFLYQMVTPVAGMTVLLGAIMFIAMLLNPATIVAAIWSMVLSTAGAYIGGVLFGLLVVILAKKPVRKFVVPILTYPVFLCPLAFLAFAAVVRPRTIWRPIKHKSERTISDLIK